MSADINRPFQGGNTSFSNTYSDMLDNRGDVFCINQSGVEIPPFAAMKLNGSLTGKARQVIKPDADSLDVSLVIFNGPQTVPVSGEFLAVNNYESIVTVNDSPTVGSELGTVSGQWYMQIGNSGYKCRGLLAGGLAYAIPFRGRDSVLLPKTIRSSDNALLYDELVEYSSGNSKTYNTNYVAFGTNPIDVSDYISAGVDSFRFHMIGDTGLYDRVLSLEVYSDSPPALSSLTAYDVRAEMYCKFADGVTTLFARTQSRLTSNLYAQSGADTTLQASVHDIFSIDISAQDIIDHGNIEEFGFTIDTTLSVNPFPIGSWYIRLKFDPTFITVIPISIEE